MIYLRPELGNLVIDCDQQPNRHYLPLRHRYRTKRVNVYLIYVSNASEANGNLIVDMKNSKQESYKFTSCCYLVKIGVFCTT